MCGTSKFGSETSPELISWTALSSAQRPYELLATTTMRMVLIAVAKDDFAGLIVGQRRRSQNGTSP